MKQNKYCRETLYKEVWDRPMGAVARSYGISDVMLKKICIKLEVPTPRRGYWAKIAAGQHPEVPALKETSGPRVAYGWGMDEGEQRAEQMAVGGDPAISTLGDAAVEYLLGVSRQIEFRARPKLRPCLQKLKDQGGCPGNVRRVNSRGNYSFDNDVSSRQAGRVAALLEAIAKGLDAIGGRMDEPFCLDLLGEKVPIQIEEKTVKEPHTITKEEQKRLDEYERNRQRYSWYGKPNIRKWDYRYEGPLSLRINISQGTEWLQERRLRASKVGFTDSADCRLEDQLPDIFLSICNVAAMARARRLDKEEQAREYAKRVAEAQKRVDRYNAEVDALGRAINELRLFDAAEGLRRYAQTVGAAGNAEYASWISAKADWLDPLVASTDEVLGKHDGPDIIPSKARAISRELPYDLRWYFEREGSQPNQSWEEFNECLNNA